MKGSCAVVGAGVYAHLTDGSGQSYGKPDIVPTCSMVGVGPLNGLILTVTPGVHPHPDPEKTGRTQLASWAWELGGIQVHRPSRIHSRQARCRATCDRRDAHCRPRSKPVAVTVPTKFGMLACPELVWERDLNDLASEERVDRRLHRTTRVYLDLAARAIFTEVLNLSAGNTPRSAATSIEIARPR